MNRLVFICHPYRGDEPHNRTRIRAICRGVLDHGDIPIAPAIYFTQFLDDEDERPKGMEAGLHLLGLCREIRIYGPPSEGMRAEIDRAAEIGIPEVWMGSNGG